MTEKYLVQNGQRLTPNAWDLIALSIGLSLFVILAWNAKQMALPFHIGDPLPISLSPSYLPEYAGQTVLRMAIALLFSLLFTFTIAPLAAKNRHAEKIIIPMIDVLQSAPVLSFMAMSLPGFIMIFPNSLLGPECAAIFVIFTSQVWNMALSLYQSLKTLPPDLLDAARVLRLSAWQRFWRIEVPFALPGLLWNMMVSLSAGWFFVVASEAISIANQQIMLPGIGSYIALAISQSSVKSVVYAILAMLIVILLYDQLIFRPLIKWAEKFRMQADNSEQQTSSWVFTLLGRTRLLVHVAEFIKLCVDAIINIKLNFFKSKTAPITAVLSKPRTHKLGVIAWYVFLTIGMALALTLLLRFVTHTVSWQQILYVFFLGGVTAFRVFVLIILCSLIWVPIGVWIGMRPKATAIAQPIAQILAAFPANIVFPVVVILIIRFKLNVEVWTTPLMILGSQWYLVFNVIAGAAALPRDLYHVSNNLGVKGWLWWRRFILPGIFPYYITGAITAAGGAWNASIVAEVVSWGDKTLQATGLGAYISKYVSIGDFPRVALGTAVMCLLVIIFNRIVWLPLYELAERRFSQH